MLTKFFSTVRQKIFDGKAWYPLVCIKFFDTLSFLKHLRDAHEIFWHCETKNFRRKNVIPPFSSIIFFETKNFFKNSRISLRKFSALWDIKISTGNRDMPPLIHKNFSIPENFRKTEGFLYKAFRFGPVRQKVPTNPWCPPPMHENFRWKNFSEAPKCSPMKYFNTVRQKLRRKIVIPPPLSKLFRYPNLLQQERIPLQNFSTLWDKKISIENLETPPPPLIHKLRYRKFSETQHKRVHLPNLSALLDKKFSTEKRDAPFFIHFFLKPKIFSKTVGFPYESFRHCEIKNFR